jgi:hypothetical protein
MQPKRSELPEALARSQNDSVLSRPARRAPRKGADGLAPSLLRPLLSRPARTIAGAALAAVLTGIVINALLLQKERRPAPFNAATGAERVVAPAAAPPAGAPIVARPPERPAGLGESATPTPLPPSRGDPIRDLLRGDAARDPAHLTLAAQNALVKLGFSVKPDGVVGASTLQAIAQFERAHGLSPSAEITPRLVRELVAAAH